MGVKGIVIAEPFKTSDYYALLLETMPEIKKSDPGNIKSPAAPSLTTMISMGSTPLKWVLKCAKFSHIPKLSTIIIN